MFALKNVFVYTLKKPDGSFLFNCVKTTTADYQ
ncbi:hypothetical protein SRA_05946 [Streptococcus ratti FA-1 = DSM 20564]|uniref:Uncharacterized protein n=1 Tax=Streptococcus ratti FA-1 = DSM 20564 TaxID=699248 RepID=A0ABN0GW93_STRRT|nr:hypothetical protein SRA_05946 [Streptococcus ratti FA-1 = DSM 20564]